MVIMRGDYFEKDKGKGSRQSWLQRDWSEKEMRKKDIKEMGEEKHCPWSQVKTKQEF